MYVMCMYVWQLSISMKHMSELKTSGAAVVFFIFHSNAVKTKNSSLYRCDVILIKLNQKNSN